MLEGNRLRNLSFYLSEKERKVVASFIPGKGGAALAPDEFRQAIDAAGFGGYCLHQTAIEQATKEFNSNEAFEIEIGEALDGTFSVRIAPDLMAAYLSCKPPQGGEPVQLQSILDDIAGKGITTPDLEAIANALHESGDNVLIAKGKPPVPGHNGSFEILFPNIKERHPHLDEHALADFRDLGDIVTVKAGDKLMRIVAPTSGEPGKTVTGKDIPVKPGEKVSFASKLNGAIIDANNPNLQLAAISGCPSALKDSVSVEPVYTVKDIDLHTGNITFDGTIHVTNDVHADMTLKASGDIYVDGTIENAMLEAGGDIIVKGGIIGVSEMHTSRGGQFHSTVNCAGSCTARFVQKAHVTAGNGIFIHDLAMLSELTAGHQIIVGDENSRKGDIIGGIARAAILVKAKNIGSDANLKTQVIVGADKRLHARLNIVIKTREAAEHKLADISKLLELAHSNPGRISPETIKSAEATRDALNAEIEALNQNEIELNHEISLADGAQVIAEKRVFGGVDICIGIKFYAVTDLKEGGVFHIREDELVFD